MKKMLLSLVAVVAFAAAPLAQAAPEYTIKIAFIGPESHGQFLELNNYFKPELEKRSGGKVVVEIYPNAQLGSDRQAIEGVSIGTLEMAAIGGSSLLSLDDRITFMDLPFLFTDGEVAYRAYDEFLTDELNKILAPHDITIVSSAELGFRHITNNRGPITKPDDLKGMKLRTMENPIHVKAFRLLGANPTPVAFSELYTALQQGTVDAQENPINVIATAKLHEVQKYLSLTGHIYSPAMVIISTSYLEDLPADIRTALLECAKEYQRRVQKVLQSQNEELLAQIKTDTEVNDLTAEQKKVFRDMVQPVYDDYIKAHGDALIKRVQAMQ